MKGSCLIDFTTSSPALADQVYVHLKAKGVYALDAPVTGGKQTLNPKHLTLGWCLREARREPARLLLRPAALGRNTAISGSGFRL